MGQATMPSKHVFWFAYLCLPSPYLKLLAPVALCECDDTRPSTWHLAFIANELLRILS